MKTRRCMLTICMLCTGILLVGLLRGWADDAAGKSKTAPPKQASTAASEKNKPMLPKPMNEMINLYTNSHLEKDIDREIRNPRTYPFKKKYDLNSGSHRGYAILTVSKTTIAINERFSINLCFFNESDGGYFYNPYMNPSIAQPLVLALYNDRKQYVGELLNPSMGIKDVLTVQNNGWIFIDSNCYLGTVKSLNMSICDSWQYKRLAPGTYYIQAIYLKSFICPNYFDKEKSGLDEKQAVQKFYRTFDRRELFRSNIVKMTFTEKLSKK